MARTTIRSTYALDVETVQLLERLARQWAVSKSEALRRAIRAAAEQGVPDEREARRVAWRQLQTGLGLTRERARRWERQVREERRAWRAPRS
ncbi:MAG TPA: ribbon-helix-helix protein, CopG family [Candidatus Binatia bacterium]|nr:ribbon-helix-helix protein, CopG family [Candidatus Binatia bacterium]